MERQSLQVSRDKRPDERPENGMAGSGWSKKETSADVVFVLCRPLYGSRHTGVIIKTLRRGDVVTRHPLL
jgi:hypothetical protein